MINTKLILIVAAAIAVIVAGYFAIRPAATPPSATSPIIATPGATEAPSPQYFHDHPSELEAAKAKCNGSTTPPEPYCTNVQKAEELLEADEYRNAVSGSAKPK